MQSGATDAEDPYLLASLAHTDELQAPIKRSGRLKYNCISVSSKLVVIGANTGGVYVFSRSEKKLLQVAFADKETNNVTLVKISPHEKYVAFACGSNVHVLDLKIESRSKAETLRSSSDLDATVTYLHWDTGNNKLYIGDDGGNVSMMTVYSNKAKNLFSLPLETIMKLDSPVSQIDKAEHKILVSTITRCYLCDTNKQQYSQIGKKLRDGLYGACFLHHSMSSPMIYSARPGSRIWEVDFDGNVLNTHQFKQLLAIPDVPVLKTDMSLSQPEGESSAANGPQSLNFPRLHMLSSNFLLTWTTSSIYVLDPVSVKVILWCKQYSGILDVCCVKEELYVFLQSMDIHRVSFLPTTTVIPLFIRESNLEGAAHLCLRNKHIFVHKHVRKRFGTNDLMKLYEKLLEAGMNRLAEAVSDTVKTVEDKVAQEQETESTGSSLSEKSRTGSIASEMSLEGVNQSNEQQVKSVNQSSELQGKSVNHSSEQQLKLGNQSSEQQLKLGNQSNEQQLKLGNQSNEQHVKLVNQSSEQQLNLADTGKPKAKDKENDASGEENIHFKAYTDKALLVNGIQSNEDNAINLVDTESDVNIDANLETGRADLPEKSDNGVDNDDFIKHVDVTGEIEAFDHHETEDGEQNQTVFGEPNQTAEQENMHNCEDVVGATVQANSGAIVGDRGKVAENNVKSQCPDIVISGDEDVQTQNCGATSDTGVVDHIDGAPSERCIKASENFDSSSTHIGANTSLSSNIQTDQSESSNSAGANMTTSDSQSEVFNEEMGGVLDRAFKARRPSLTSLSSLSSAEVNIEQSPTYGVEESEEIAIPVKRRSSKKRRSSTVTKTEKWARLNRSHSSGSIQSNQSLKEGTPPGCVRGVIEEDCASIYSNDSVTLDETVRVDNVTDSPDSRSLDRLSLGSPSSRSADFTLSADFTHSVEYSRTAAFTRSADFGKHGGEFSESGEYSSWATQTSAPKAALKNLKEKVQIRGKKLLKNIKEKNLVTKAKGLVENLSQGSEAYLNTAFDSPYSDVPDIVVTNGLEARSPVTNSNQNLADDNHSTNEDNTTKPVVDLSKLEAVTIATQEKLDDLEICMNPDAFQKTLLDWVTVLNETFYQLHLKKYGNQSNKASAKDYETIEDFENSTKMNAPVDTCGKDVQDNSTKESDTQIEIGETDANIAGDKIFNREHDTTDDKDISSKDITNKDINKEINKEINTELKKADDNLVLPDSVFSDVLNDTEFCYVNDPLHLPKHLLKSTQELAQACFDISCHGNILSYQKIRHIEEEKCNHGGFNDIGTVTEIKGETVGDKNEIKVINSIAAHSSKEICDEAKVIVSDLATADCDKNDLDLDCSKGQSCSEIADATVSKGDNVKRELCDTRGSHPDACETKKSHSGKYEMERSHSDDTCDTKGSHPGTVYDTKGSHSAHNSKHNSIDGVQGGSCDTEAHGGHAEAMSFYVRCYTPYLDIHRVREEVLSGRLGYDVWCALLTTMELLSRLDIEKYGIEERSIIQHLLDNKAHLDQGALLLGHISKLFRRQSNSMLDVVMRCHTYIQPLDVLYLCWYHGVTMDTVFKQYMMWMTCEAPDSIKERTMEFIQRHAALCLTWLEMLLADGWKPDAVFAEDDHPKPMSHKITWKNQGLIDKYLGKDFMNMESELMNLFAKYGYWCGVLRLFKCAGCAQDHLTLILQLGDKHLLCNHSDKGYLPKSMDEWQTLLEAFKQTGNQSVPEEQSDWSDKITWNNLAILLVRYVGPEMAVSLLEKQEVPEGVLTTEFHHACLLSGMVENHQRSLLHSMLEKVDTYLWSQRPTAVSPQLHYLSVSEKGLQVTDSKHPDVVHLLSNKLREPDVSRRQSVEDPECHWGVSSKTNILCPCCNIALREPVSHEMPGVLLFKCGHAYHKLCLPSRECLLCDP